MNTPPALLRRLARASALAAFAATALSGVALADGPTQPDPPVPMEAIPASSALPAADTQEPDCRCSALYARDLEGRIEGHVERWESLPRSSATAERARMRARATPLHTASFVEGVVGFPLHDFRLAADEQSRPL